MSLITVVMKVKVSQKANKSKGDLLMKKLFVAVLFFFNVVVLTSGGNTVKAIEEDIVKINPDADVLVVFSTEHWVVDENIRLLDLSIGHFSDHIEYKNVHEVEPSDVEDKTHLFYYGHIKEEISPEFSEIVSSFEGPTMAIGYNTEQLGEKYSFLNVSGEKNHYKFRLSRRPRKIKRYKLKYYL